MHHKFTRKQCLRQVNFLIPANFPATPITHINPDTFSELNRDYDAGFRYNPPPKHDPLDRFTKRVS